MKLRDDEARDHADFDVTAEETKSVASGRELDQIATGTASGDRERTASKRMLECSKGGEEKQVRGTKNSEKTKSARAKSSEAAKSRSRKRIDGCDLRSPSMSKSN